MFIQISDHFAFLLVPQCINQKLPMTIPMMFSSPNGHRIAVPAHMATIFVEVEHVLGAFKRNIRIAHQLLAQIV